ncbi:bifunctional DNA-formamidopyrimidine glycosylase/DNA-(apurinic or apyrimidinic site) lyase [Martelella lutilitoris]|uniref:Formamidopyrimidine-DNA glycosylase n=1 Tax=Martelella lutilitoris TaxID=2583532 RepID=A0A5C4JPL9_9HYPH|nr:bifunctional DNA-formamidopyrimidine glycosylase/DNA-(apurinic or apyrimidinic site) lyase [Martelella lutilitoris]TNB47425.1 bifunctional DNA-formamidopyrimidine glycosylase/DNA-(apurinic or apyrimidinic site) lyase [Martelella lutilitoris]
MPELPEVETVRRGLAPAMEGRRIEKLVLNRSDLRFPFPENLVKTVENRTIVALGRRAKYLLIDLDDGMTVIAHLGMSGSWRVEEEDDAHLPGRFHAPRSVNALHDHVIIELSGAPARRIVYNDPRRFGFIKLARKAELEAEPSFAGLGPEPTGNSLDAEFLAARFAGKTQAIKTALLDQRNIAGLGNIYVCEALWRARLSPFRSAGHLVTPTGRPREGLKTLVPAIRAVIAEAIEAGGSTLRDHRKTDGTLGYFQHSFSVYDRTGAPCAHADCNGTVARAVQSGRSTFYCPACQKG